MKLKKPVGWVVAAGCLALLLTGAAQANNIAVTTVGLAGLDTSAKTVNVVFDLSWSNSWRGSENRDAAWVFVKFRAPGSNNWEHAILSTNNADHKAAASSTISAVPDGRGVFVYSTADQTGNVSYAQMKLRWNYGTNGHAFAAGAVVEVSVHAIEMVFIPEGAFYVGSGGSETAHFYAPDGTAQTTNAYLVSSENAITVGTSPGNLYYSATGGNYGDGLGTISNAFPKGYAAFYCMKYEVSQGQYADFLNKLNATQAGTRFPNYYNQQRHTINSISATNYSAGVPDRACNFLSWADGIAYADWAALRPMTELEFEKVCRGPANPVANEYAWGNTGYTNLTAEAGDGTGTSRVSTVAGANCLVESTLGGPTRVGIFATTNSTRASSGAGYYGVMELSGNVVERPVTVGRPEGRVFRGSLGDGVLNGTGDAMGNADWPSTGTGGSLRGGDKDQGNANARVSDRTLAAATTSARVWYTHGWRGVRQAP